TIMKKNRDGELAETHLFTVFDSFREFWGFQKKFPEEMKSFYELCFGEVYQKPRLDIDLSLDNEFLDEGTTIEEITTFSETLIENIITILQSLIPTFNIERD